MGIPFTILFMAVSGIILALAYKLSPSQWKQSINHFFYLEEESK
jgi:hypothetical protein